MALTAGARLGPYEIVNALGAGGMGEVYRAHDTRLDRTVAIKVLASSLAADPQFRERFEREARSIAALNHPHICVLHDIGRAAPSPRPSPARAGGEGAGANMADAASAGAEPVDFLVMEYLEGETLAARLAAGPLPAADVIRYAIQVADALDKAHRRGIVHRDLKPGNVFLTRSGGPSGPLIAKLLDFGLAKAAGHSPAPGAGATAVGPAASPPLVPTALPTTPASLTQHGTILGKYHYMAPEQLEGREADARSDVFAFGAVLYEMATGRKAFTGKSTISVMAAILEHDPPPISAIHDRPSEFPPEFERLVRTCLAKDPEDRWQTARDVARELAWIEERMRAKPAPTGVVPGAVARAQGGDVQAEAHAASIPGPVPRRRVLLGSVLGLVTGVVLAALAGWIAMTLSPDEPAQPMRFAIALPQAQPLNPSGADRNVAISPAGTHIVYRAGGAQPLLVVRAIDQLEAQPLAATEGARIPFFSPDGRWIGFFATGGELKKVSVTGGPAITLCRFTGGPRGASWGDDDTIVFATADASAGLSRVAGGGGEPKALTKPAAAKGEGDHLFPSVLPGSRAVLFTITASGDQPENSQVAVLDLTTGQSRTLVPGGSHAEYVAPGYVVYAAFGSLRAVRFDLDRLEVTSDPVPVVEQVMTSGTGAANYAVSRAGALVFIPGSMSGMGGAARSLVWVTRQGREEPLKAPPRAYVTARLSPDGTRVALDVRDQEQDIWVWDLGRETLTRLTFDSGPDMFPVWTPDGRRIVFSSVRARGALNLYWQAADGTGAVERLTTSPNQQNASSMTPDGSRVVLTEAAGTADIVALTLGSPPVSAAATQPGPPPAASPSGAATGDRLEVLVRTAFAEISPQVSPDGRWMAYASNESGRSEVYVRPFPQVNSGRWQVSTGGGIKPVWARSGRELFYLDGSNQLISAPVQTMGGTFVAGNPTKLLEGRYFVGAPQVQPYDVSPDGQRFLMIKESAASEQTPNAAPASLVVVLNWVEELRQRVGR